jgi:hypothetical protein
MTVHENSRAALASLDLSERESLVLKAYLSEPLPITDRHVAGILGFTDCNAVKPRISSMIDRGILVERASVRCPITGKTVRTCEPAVRP